jgi:hypothetical protein
MQVNIILFSNLQGKLKILTHKKLNLLGLIFPDLNKKSKTQGKKL